MIFNLAKKLQPVRDSADAAQKAAEEAARKAFEEIHANRLAVSKLLERLDCFANDTEGQDQRQALRSDAPFDRA
jgi:hypothetical protein